MRRRFRNGSSGPNSRSRGVVVEADVAPRDVVDEITIFGIGPATRRGRARARGRRSSPGRRSSSVRVSGSRERKSRTAGLSSPIVTSTDVDRAENRTTVPTICSTPSSGFQSRRRRRDRWRRRRERWRCRCSVLQARLAVAAAATGNSAGVDGTAAGGGGPGASVVAAALAIAAGVTGAPVDAVLQCRRWSRVLSRPPGSAEPLRPKKHLLPSIRYKVIPYAQVTSGSGGR